MALLLTWVVLVHHQHHHFEHPDDVGLKHDVIWTTILKQRTC